MKNSTVNSIVLIIILLVVWGQSGWGQIPEKINYQGVLTNASNEAVPDGNYNIKFKLFDAVTNGTMLWEEIQAVSVINGNFNIILGSVNPIKLAFDKPCWLGVEINNEQLTPRKEFTSTAYSFTSKSVLGSSNIFPSAGNVGIGTLTPNAKLHIGGTPGVDGIKFPDGSLQTKAATETGLTLPYAGSTGAEGTAAFSITHNGLNSTGYATAGLFKIDNTENNASALTATTNGAGSAIYGYSTGNGAAIRSSAEGTGAAALFEINNTKNNDYVLRAQSRGTGRAGWFLITNTDNGSTALQTQTNGTGTAFLANQTGLSGNIAEFQSDEETKVVINKSGFIGIGTSEVTAPLTVGVVNTGSSWSSNIQLLRQGTALDARMAISNDGLLFRNFSITSTAFGFRNSSDANMMQILSNGNVGIGIGNPKAKLHIGGTAGVDGIKFPDGSLQTTAAFSSPADGHSLDAADGDPTDAVYVDDLGFVGIGTKDHYSQLHVIRNNEDQRGNVAIRGCSTGGMIGNCGIQGVAMDTKKGDVSIGIFGNAIGSITNYAGYFQGHVHIIGTLSKSAGAFKIDHPLDPENKYLSHSFVESPDMMNVYNGNIILDTDGEAWIELAEWFDALNKDFRYQLTCIGGFAPVYIAEKIADNRFKIAGGKQGMEISWQVTGIRKDAYAEANRILVEEEKRINDRGKYLHPKLFGQPETNKINYIDPQNIYDHK